MEPYWTEWRRVVLRRPRNLIAWGIWLLRSFITLNLTGSVIHNYGQGPPASYSTGDAVLWYIMGTAFYGVLLVILWLLPHWTIRQIRRRYGG